MPLTQVRSGGIADNAITSVKIVAGAIEDSDISTSASILGETASDATLNADKTIAANKNVMMVGPIEIDDGVTITIPSTSRLVILG